MMAGLEEDELLSTIAEERKRLVTATKRSQSEPVSRRWRSGRAMMTGTHRRAQRARGSEAPGARPRRRTKKPQGDRDQVVAEGTDLLDPATAPIPEVERQKRMEAAAGTARQECARPAHAQLSERSAYSDLQGARGARAHRSARRILLSDVPGAR